MDSIASHFHRNGFFSPIRVLSDAQIFSYRSLLYDTLMGKLEDPLVSHRYVWQLHLLMPWLAELVQQPSILDAVEQVLGPNILVWNSGFIIKWPEDNQYTSWHQDRTFWGLRPERAVTAWIAFTKSTRENGCLWMVPGTHRKGQIEHANRYAKGNMLSRGQEIDLDISSNKAVAVDLRPGEMSLHDVSIIHSSEPNTSDEIRIGCNITYIVPEVTQTLGPDTAYLVRGQDNHRNFFLAPTPHDSESKETKEYYAKAALERGNILARESSVN